MKRMAPLPTPTQASTLTSSVPFPPTSQTSSTGDTVSSTPTRKQKRPHRPVPQNLQRQSTTVKDTPSFTDQPLTPFQEALLQLQKYEIVCREQTLQVIHLSSQLTDLRTVYNFEVAQNQYLLNVLAEKDQQLEHERSHVLHLQHALFSMYHSFPQQQQQQQQPEELLDHGSNDAGMASNRMEQGYEQQRDQLDASSGAERNLRSDVTNNDSFGHSLNQNHVSLGPRGFHFQNIGYNFEPFAQPGTQTEGISPSVSNLEHAGHTQNNDSNSKDQPCPPLVDISSAEGNESDSEVIDVVGISPPSPVRCESSDPTSSPVVISASASTDEVHPVEVKITSVCFQNGNDEAFSMNKLGDEGGCNYSWRFTNNPEEKMEIGKVADQSQDYVRDGSCVVGEQEKLHPSNNNQTGVSPPSECGVKELIPVVEIEPLMFSNCDSSLSYCSNPRPMLSPSSLQIDLSTLNWKPFDQASVDCTTEKGVAHASGYAIVQVDRVQHLSFRHRRSSKSKPTQAQGQTSASSKVKYKTKNPNANYLARIREEAFLDDGQKVFSVDYLKMNKVPSLNVERKMKSVNYSFTFTPYSTDYGRNYLCLQQDVVVYLPEPKLDRRGKISFSNFQFEPYNLRS